MENLTIGSIASSLAFIAGFIGSVKYLKSSLTASIDKTFDKKLEPIREEINKLKLETNKNHLEALKTDLIDLMELADKKLLSTEQNIRVHELYDYYCKNGGNSYIHDKWEKLKKEGKL